MSDVAFITHPVFLEHDTGAFHPECAKRLSAIYDKIKISPLNSSLKQFESAPATNDDLAAVHDQSYIFHTRIRILNGERNLDGGDTVVCEKSYDAAIYAAGAVCMGIDQIKKGQTQRVFCAVRPPGHHAEKDMAMGFCIFNNVALAARYSQKIGLAKRVLIIDWDVHHGNGTQHIFEEDDSVFYYSMHQFPFYPGTGTEAETGRGKGKGFTLNRPLPPGCGDSEYLQYFESDLNEIKKRFHPDLVVISAGFDAHADDPLGGMNVSEYGYRRMTEMAVGFANENAGGRILSVLEGGYNLDALAKSVLTHLNVLINE